MKEKIIEKIKKALALANNNKNPNEAQAAMLMAQKMIAKYYIEMQEVLEPIIEEVKKIINAIREKIIKSVDDKTIKKCLHISKNSKNKRIQKKQITRINKIMKWYIRQATYELKTNSK